MTSPDIIKKPASARAANRSKPIGVLVLGMHRSGTSALTRVLNLLGCTLPEALVGPSEGNELGHWESASAVILNDEILASAGSSWNDWGPINADWRASGVKAQMVERAGEVVREHKALGPLFVLKDPRLCRLADLWLEAADKVGVDMRVVLMLRHPGEVAASLESRDLMAEGYGQLLWLRHALDAEHLSRGRKRVVCRFERLLEDWQETINRIRQGLSLALPRNSPAAHAEIDQFLTRNMRHHDARAEAGLGLLAASDWVRRTFEILCSWSEQGEQPADHAELDRIRTEFDNAYPAFSRLLLSPEFAGQFAIGSRLRNQLQDQLAEVSNRMEEIERQASEIQALRMRGAELEGKVAALTAAYETTQARAEALQAETEALKTSAARASTLDSEVESLRRRESELADEARHVARARDEAESALATLQAEIESLQASAARVAVLEDELARIAAGKAELEALTEALDAQLLEARSEIQSEHELRTELEKDKVGREAELAAERLRNAELTGRIVAAESAAVQRQEELAQLWRQLETLQQAAGAAALEIEVERERRSEAETQLAKAQEAAVAAAAETAIERERRNEAEARLAAVSRDLSGLAAEKSELEARVRAAENTVVERHAELAQLWNQLGTVQQAAGAASTEAAVERERRGEAEARLAAAEQDLRGVTAEKAELEIRVRIAEMALASQRDENVRASEQIAKAKAAATEAATETARERELRLEGEARLARSEADVAELRARLEALQQAPAPPPAALFSEMAQLTRLLQVSETDAATARAAREAAERRIAEQTEELVRLSALLSQESSRAEGNAEHAEWLREMAHVAERMPKWWALMPEGWRRKREHEAYRRAGLFDARLYIQNYPDVAADGMDPVRHYIQHGMVEGRQMWR